MGAIEEALARRREQEAAEAQQTAAPQEEQKPPPPLVLDGGPVIPESGPGIIGGLNTANMSADGNAPKDVIPASRTGPQPSEPVAVSPVAKRAARTFYHLYAGAGVVMPNGSRLTFGGKPGSRGIFVTDKMEETAYLEELANTPGSQVSEDLSHVSTEEFEHEQAEALEDSRRNTLLDLDPNVVAARANLGRNIAQGS